MLHLLCCSLVSPLIVKDLSVLACCYSQVLAQENFKINLLFLARNSALIRKVEPPLSFSSQLQVRLSPKAASNSEGKMQVSSDHHQNFPLNRKAESFDTLFSALVSSAL